MAERITVAGDASYDVLIGRNVVTSLETMLGADVGQVLVVHPASPPVATIATRVADALAGRATVVVVDIPDGENAKDLPTADRLWTALAQHDFTRSDALVAVGGGATTDVVGFAAATWLRGVPVIHLPTTLLGMVDAAVGGKTGINTAEGKNLVGAFHPPAGVICDLELLVTLPQDDLVAGLAEVVKAGFIADPGILERIEADPRQALDPSGDVLLELVSRAVQVKADVVSADLREAGPREILNYGHTLGHAIEKVEGFRPRHGQAVSIGMVFAAEVAQRLGRLDDETFHRHRAVLGSLGLATSYDGAPWPALRDAMRVDKKGRGGMLRLVLLDGLAKPVTVPAPNEDVLEQAYTAVRG